MAQIIAGGTKPDSGGNVEVITQVQTAQWKQLQGKPYILVSSKGIANGLSNIPNDGADFGLDTPGTQTMGALEAFNYAETLKGAKIQFTEGLFYFNESVVWQSQYPVEVSGIRPNFVRGSPLRENGTIIMPGPDFDTTTDTSLFEFLNSNENNNDGFVYFHDMGIIGSYVQPGGTIPSENISPAYPIGIQIGNTTTSEGNGPVAMLIENVKIVVCSIGIETYSGGGPVYMDNLHLDGNGTGLNLYSQAIIGKVQFFSNNYYNIVIQNASSALAQQNYVQISEMTMNAPSDNPMILLNAASYSNNSLNIDNLIILPGTSYSIFQQGNTGGWNINVGNLYTTQPILNIGTGTPGIVNINIGNAYFTNATNLFYGTASAASGSTMSISNAYLASVSSTFLTSSLTNLLTVFRHILPAPSPTTPSVPASGTALQNTNPYAVEVYLNGGTVTEITRTSGGTTYTVLTSTTGIALEGKTVKLNPSDSITLTYTTAPTWSWAPA